MKTKLTIVVSFLIINFLNAQKTNFPKNIVGFWKISEKSTEVYFLDLVENYKRSDVALAGQLESQKDVLIKSYIPEIQYQFNEDFSLNIIYI